MSEYKVLQDIEGEDHIIGWLTPRQTIYAAIVVVSLILAYVMGRLNFLLAVPWIIPIGFFGFLAAPLGKDQPNDVWAAAQIRFYFKSRKRLWDQSGMEDLIKITAPKKVEKIYTDGLDQTQVRSRLQALSSTIDSRGWAIKGAALSMPVMNNPYSDNADDRLLESNALPQEVPTSDITEADDILDIDNAMAQRLEEQIKIQEQKRMDQVKQRIASPQTQPVSQPQGQNTPRDFYFMQHPAQTGPVQSQEQPVQLATFSSQIVAPGAQPSEASTNIPAEQSSTVSQVDEQALLEKIRKEKEATSQMSQSHMRVIKTPQQLAEEQAMQEKQRKEAEQKTAQATAPDAILKQLSQSDLKVSTISSVAKNAEKKDDGEVVISLH